MSADPVAAAVHRKRADEHWHKVERFRRLGMTRAEISATEAARREDDLAYMLSTGKEPPHRAASHQDRS